MILFIIYSLKLSVCLSVIYLFYYLFLRTLTFYTWNRWFLWGGTLLSVFIPFVSVTSLFKTDENAQFTIIKYIPKLGSLTINTKAVETESNIFIDIILPALPIIFLVGFAVLGLKMLLQFISFFRLVKAATLVPDTAINLYEVEKEIAPFSFGNAIFLNKNLLKPEELQEVIRHELVHIRQNHTLDVLWFEGLCLLNWFNPFVWLLRWAARQNLEFIADSQVLQTPGADKRYYQYLLLKIIGSTDFKIAPSFNLSPLKTRIIMMNRTPSTKQNLIKYLFALPVMAGLLFACQNTTDSAFADLAKNEKVLPPPPPPVLAEPALPPPPPPMRDKFEAPYISPDILPADHEEFIKRNPNVKLLAWNMQGRVIIYLKSGEEELYDLTHSVSAAMAEKKYGKLPNYPFPTNINKFKLQSKKAAQVPQDFKNMMERNSSLKNLVGMQEDMC